GRGGADYLRRHHVLDAPASGLHIVQATVSDGIVTLRGEVETELESSAARVAAERVRGVGGVVNKITLASAW
ncbi:BON domain-containing protein, partial [Rhizobium ruizarguesonis]